MTLEKFVKSLKGGSGSGNFGHSGRPGKHGGSSSGGAGGRVVQSKAEISGILKKSGFSAAKRGSAGKVRGSRSYEQSGYEVEFTKGPRGTSAFIKVITSAHRSSGKVPTLPEIKKVLENEGFNVKDTNWEGGGLDVR